MILPELEEAYRAYQCDPAFDHMRRLGSTFVSGIGNPEKPLLMFIGEAPGRTEDKRGEPFVGASGKLLDAACRQAGVDRLAECWTTNVVKYRPVDGRGGNRTPDDEEVEASRPYLRSEVLAIGPRVLVPLGGSALACVDHGAAEGQLRRGRATQVGRWLYLPLWHPAYVLRKRGLEGRTGEQFVDDIRQAVGLAWNG